ncbi:MAG: TonB-dependent receptor [Bacteroidota bacterium]
MKLITLFLFIFCIDANAELYSQKVTISYKDVPLSKVFKEMQKQTGCTFVYTESLLKKAGKVTLSVKDIPLEEALEICFQDQPLTYTILNKIVIIKERPIINKKKETPVVLEKLPISGEVTNDKGEALEGATITEKGNTNNRVLSKKDGSFSLEVNNDQSILDISFVGYISQSVSVKGRGNIKIILLQSNTSLSEVVINVGYGSVKKKNLTTAVGTVDGKVLRDQPISSFQQGVQGRVAGVQVTQTNGKPGTGLSVRVRNSNSINGSSDPLYVVDGVPVLYTDGINPADIETVQILKDAAAQAIYGSRGTNGVILITTKKGRSGTPEVNISQTYGSNQVVKKLDVLGSKDFGRLLNEELANAGQGPIVDPDTLSINTNWQDELYRHAPFTNTQMSVSGGSDKHTYYFGVGYLKEDGIIEPASFKRYSIRLNQDIKVNNALTVGNNFNLSRTDSRDVSDNARVNNGGVILSALTTPPTILPKNEDGTYSQNPYQAWENPIALTKGALSKTFGNRFNGNIFAELKLPYSLRLRSSFGVDAYTKRNDYYIDPFTTNSGRAQNGFVKQFNEEELIWISENTLSFNKTISNVHKIEAIVGNAAQLSTYNNGLLEAKNFTSGSVTTANAASEKITTSTYRSSWSFASFFGRFVYNYNDRYILSGSLRADGSSRFGPDKKWGYFPGLSAAWRLSNESFLKGHRYITDLKLRASYGITGNANGFGDFAYLGTYGAGVNYQFEDVQPGSVSNTISNMALHWEKTAQSNIGFDLALFRDERVVVSADYYHKKTTELLLNKPLPNSSGYGSALQNQGQLSSEGLEILLNTKNIIKKDFTWSSTLVFTKSKVTVDNILGATLYYGGAGDNGNAIVIEEGQSLGNFYGYISDGVNLSTGDIIFRDISGKGTNGKADGIPDGKIDAFDRTIIGNALPDFTAGLTNMFTYKALDLSFFLDASYGNDVFNASRIETEGMFTYKNASTSVLNRWMTSGQETDMPRAVFGDPNQNTRNSTRWIEDGSYVKLRSATLGYTFAPGRNKLAFVKGVRVYLSGRNLFTLTDYKGYDPEVNNDSNSLVVGIDYGTYPQVRTMTFGVSFKF